MSVSEKNFERKEFQEGIYAHGLPFSEILSINLDDLLERIDNKKASCIILDGLMGEGKTTLAVEIAEYIEKVRQRKIDVVRTDGEYFYSSQSLDLSKQLSMGGEEFQEKLQLCVDSKLHVIIYDEAGDFSKRGAITQFNQRLNRIFQTFRAFKILVIINLPLFNILDNDLFLQGIPRLLLNCNDRNKRQGNFRGYGLEEMYYLKHYMKSEVVPIKAYSKVTPNFRGHFLNLPSKYSRELEAISTKSKKETLSTNILKNKGLVSYYDIAKRLAKSPHTIRFKLKELKIKPTTKYKQMNYYEGGVVPLLEQAFER